jgi:hypothetical protein
VALDLFLLNWRIILLLLGGHALSFVYHNFVSPALR